MRPSFLATIFVLTVAPGWAEPVKAGSTFERAKLDALWVQLDSYDTVERARALLDLVEHPQTVPYLAEKIRPLIVSKDRTIQWMRELNHLDPEVRERAYGELKYYDPRLNLDLAEQFELAKSDRAKLKLIAIWSEYDDSEYTIPASARIELRIKKYRDTVGDVAYDWIQNSFHNRNFQHSGQGRVRVQPLAELARPEWIVQALAAIVLDRIGTREARMVLDRIAAGHPQSLPARTAASLRRTGPPAPLGKKFWQTDWPAWHGQEPRRQAVLLFELADDAETILGLKSKLPAIKADKSSVRKWIADLGGSDEGIRSEALRSLRYFHPSLAFPIQAQIELAVDDQTRTGLFHFYSRSDDSVRSTVTNSALVATWDVLRFYERANPKQFRELGGSRIEPLGELDPVSWQRARLAIIALEHNASDDAVAVLKQLAEGHPDILPTKEAKAALKKLGK